MALEDKITEVVDATNRLTRVVEGSVVAIKTESLASIARTESEASKQVAAVGLTANDNYKKSISNVPAFVNAGDAVTTQCELKVNVDNAVYKFAENTAVQMPALTSGTDYAIYATANGLMASANYTAPAGYTPALSRRIGGFHYGDGRIYPRSFWDLKFKPTCSDPRGMVRTYQGFWADIYLLNTTPDLLGTSAYNAQIADGASTPKKPAAWGGNGIEQYTSLTQYIATEVLSAYGKRLPNQHEFSVLAQGSKTGHTSVTDPIKTQFDAEARSLIDCEQVSGHLWQWGSEMCGEGAGWRAVDTDNKGQVHSARNNASRFGADWGHAGFAGSRASDWVSEPWHSSDYVSARGVCDHLQLL